MSEPLAYLNGDFLPTSQLCLAADDLGFVQGVAVSERLRTFNGRLFRLGEHLERLENSLRMVDLLSHVAIAEIGRATQELVIRNADLLEDGDDLGISLFVTPGRVAGGPPTVGIQACPLPFGQWAAYYDRGQSLAETGVRQVPSSCWPAALKCRSRMHYFLADQLAHKQFPGARAILLDQEGFVSEASTANVVIFREGDGLVSPPLERILPGVSLSALAGLAGQLAIGFSYRDLRLEDLRAADEVLLCSTSPCVWPVTSLNGQSIGRGATGTAYRRLLAAWSAMVGLDVAAQAVRFRHRT
jgi:branched-subunit amino acid aminotransferase/4-amino-4-deoxychorismate lyase